MDSRVYVEVKLVVAARCIYTPSAKGIARTGNKAFSPIVYLNCLIEEQMTTFIGSLGARSLILRC